MFDAIVDGVFTSEISLIAGASARADRLPIDLLILRPVFFVVRPPLVWRDARDFLERPRLRPLLFLDFAIIVYCIFIKRSYI